MKGPGPSAPGRRHAPRAVSAAVVVACSMVALAGSTPGLAGAAGSPSSPYPSTLALQRGLTMSQYGQALPWGTQLTAKQTQSVQLRSSDLAYRWAVWGKTGGPEFPVRDVDLDDILYAGSRWTAAGPQLATDGRAGGSTTSPGSSRRARRRS